MNISITRCLLPFTAVLVVACSGSDGGGGIPTEGKSPTESSQDGGAADRDGTSSANRAPEGPTCKEAEDCPYWYCDCSAGPPVNARHCENQRCATAADTCPNACAAFGETWLGTAGGGWKSGSGSSGGGSKGGGGGTGCGDGTSYADLGTTCSTEATCESNLCVGTQQHTFCTKACDTSDNCPRGWVCAGVQGLTTKACLIGDVVATSPVSTNTACKDKVFPDTGLACTSPFQCSSGVCGGSTNPSARYCTERCNSAADCPAGMGCVQNTGDTMKTCVK